MFLATSSKRVFELSFLELRASYDVARNICQALPDGVGGMHPFLATSSTLILIPPFLLSYRHPMTGRGIGISAKSPT
jgi:hypothetical protein